MGRKVDKGWMRMEIEEGRLSRGGVGGKWVERPGGSDREWMRLEVEEGREPTPVLNTMGL